MGKGDKKTKRGKIFMGSFGVRRPKNIKKEIIVKAEKKTKKVEVENAEIKPAKKPAAKKPKKETKESAE
jgi:30S ribosomal protein S31